MQQVPFFLHVAKVISTFLPALFILNQMLNQIGVIPKLRVDHLDIGLILPQKHSNVCKRRPNFLS